MSSIAPAVRGFGHALALAGRRPRLSILIFHRVLEERDPLLPGEPDAASFEARMRFLRSAFKVMSLADSVSRLRDGTLPVNAACITFDDGYADNATVALPILRRLRLPATFFVSSGFLDGGRMWNDTVIEAVRIAPGPRLDLTEIGLGVRACSSAAERVQAIAGLLDRLKYQPQPERTAKVAELAALMGVPSHSALMMTRSQVRLLHRWHMSVGAHTVTHPILTTLNESDAQHEILAGKQDLEAVIDAPVRLFAYPNGRPKQDYDATHVKIVHALGFDAAVSTASGSADASCDPFQLPRFTPWSTDTNRFGIQLARNLLQQPASVS